MGPKDHDHKSAGRMVLPEPCYGRFDPIDKKKSKDYQGSHQSKILDRFDDSSRDLVLCFKRTGLVTGLVRTHAIDFKGRVTGPWSPVGALQMIGLLLPQVCLCANRGRHIFGRSQLPWGGRICILLASRELRRKCSSTGPVHG